MARVAHGVADASSGEALTPAHRFRIASHSKALAAIATMRLVDDGRLRLDDEAQLHVPALRGTDAGALLLRELLSHGGGAVPYHWGRYRGLADMLKRPPLATHVMRNVYFDTCVYHQPGIDLLFEVIEIDNILFGSEMVGAVRGIDPQTGFYFDDTKRYVDNLDIPAEDKRKVFELNARRVYPRLDAILKARGL